MRPEPLISRTPPNNQEAERAVLAGLFDQFRGMDTLEVPITPADFYSVWHATIFESMLSLRERKIPIEHIALKNDLVRRGVAVDTERVMNLLTLENDTVPTAANVNYYSRVVIAMKRKRVLIETGARILELGFTNGKVKELYSKASELLFTASQDRSAQKIVDGAGMAKEVWDHLNNPNREPGVVSGWFALDQVIQCFRPGEMSVLAARPSMGKSALMNSLLVAMLKRGERVGCCSLEMDRLQLACNAIGAQVGVDTTRIRRGVFGEVEPGRFDDAVAKRETSLTIDGVEWLAEFGDRLAIFDGEAYNVTDLSRVLERMVTQNQVRFVAIDYMQLLDGGDVSRGLGRYAEVTEISKGLKRLAKRLKIHVMVLAQLNRKVEERRDKKPIMADLRDSGQVEQDADVIMLLHRPEYYWPDKEDLAGLGILNVAKNRNGPTGVVRLAFTKRFTRFEPE